MLGNDSPGDIKGPAELGTQSRRSRDPTAAKLITKIHNQCNIFPMCPFIHSSNGTGNKLVKVTE